MEKLSRLIKGPDLIVAPCALNPIMAQMAALAYVDHWLGVLFETVRERAPTLAVICSDHGTAYGEDGYVGHRISHPGVWDVPYAELVLSGGQP